MPRVFDRHRHHCSPEQMIARFHAIADELHLTAAQRAAFDEMSVVAAEAREALRPEFADDERPSTALDMLATTQVFTAAAQGALNRLQQPLEAFLATLTEAQRARFDALVTTGQPPRGRPRYRQRRRSYRYGHTGCRAAALA